MNYDETLSTLKAIQAAYSATPFLIDPETEPRFIINSDKREIEIPDEFKFLAVKTDHVSEKIYFEVDRYFDGEDLSTKACVVQYINTGDGGSVEGIYPVTYIDLTTNPKKIIFRWEVDNNVSKYAGMVSFSVRFYTISDDNRFTYSWNTIPAQLPILDTINNTGNTVSENYPTELVEWNYRMQQLDRTISEKIATATESIDANTKAAQAARKGAEDAEARVNAIVAGNEAYTKQQSHDLFALALRGTAEAAKSIKIYPDKGSNVVATINGFTNQEGSGDASPDNIRAIISGGKYFYEKVYTGTEGWAKYSDSPYSYYVSTPAGVGTIHTGISSFYDNLDSPNIGKKTGIYLSQTLSVIITDLECPDVNSLKSKLQKLNANGKPLTIWFKKYENGKPETWAPQKRPFIPIIGRGGLFVGVCAELTAPLCKDDKFITKVKSGCDKVLVLDGTQNMYYHEENSYIIVTVDNPKNESYPISDYIPKISPFQNTSGLYVINGSIIVKHPALTSLQAAKEYLAAHPLTVWYRSTNYTPAADIPVSLETHVQEVLVLDGTENISTSAIDAGVRFEISYGSISNVPADGSSVGNLYCSHYKPVGRLETYRGNQVVSFTGPGRRGVYVVDDRYIGDSDATNFKASLAAQYAAGTPVTIVHEIATPITYAHEPVDFIASPDEDGAWVITGEADGTVSAEFNKSITKTFEELVQRVSALELQAFGG